MAHRSDVALLTRATSAGTHPTNATIRIRFPQRHQRVAVGDDGQDCPSSLLSWAQELTDTLNLGLPHRAHNLPTVTDTCCEQP